MIGSAKKYSTVAELFELCKNKIDTSDSDYRDLPFVGMENIESGSRRYLPQNLSVPEGLCYRFDSSHVLYGKLRPYLNKVMLPDFSGKCSTEIVPLKPKNGFSREFVATVLQSTYFIEQAVKHSTGGRMPRADLKYLLGLKLRLPVADQANALATELQTRLAHVEAMRQAALKQVEGIESLSAAILREAFDFGKDETE